MNMCIRLVFPLLFLTIFNIIKIIVGSIYYQIQCNKNAVTFLLLDGGILVTTFVSIQIAILTPNRYDDLIAKIISGLATFTIFFLNIWGTVIIGKYSKYLFRLVFERLKNSIDFNPRPSENFGQKPSHIHLIEQPQIVCNPL